MSPGFWHGATVAFVITHVGYMIYLRSIRALPWQRGAQQSGDSGG